MKIAIAQVRPVKGEVNANVQSHLSLINLAVSHQADAIFFPELSLTGYDASLAKEWASTPSDNRFEVFQNLSNNTKITIGLGMPTKANSGIAVSMLIYQPNIAVQVYSKQLLHPDEFPFFIKGERQVILNIGNKKVSPAICYESLQRSHTENAVDQGAEIYVASVAKSQQGMKKAMIDYPATAKQFSIPVLVSNCLGYCDTFESVGQSAVWTKHGELVAQLDDQHEGLLIFDTERQDAQKLFL